MIDNLTTCLHCGSDACYVSENSPTIKTYSCCGCGMFELVLWICGGFIGCYDGGIL